MAGNTHDRIVGERPGPVSPEVFRQGMRRFAGVCTIITSADASGNRAGWVGLTATAVSSVTADPPRILVCVNRSAFAHATIVNSGVLGVNVLAAVNGPLLAGRFGGAASTVAEKFEDRKWTLGDLGVPLLNECLLNLECVVCDVITHSTHDIIICDVVNVNCVSQYNDPLIYFDGSFNSPDVVN